MPVNTMPISIGASAELSRAAAELPVETGYGCSAGVLSVSTLIGLMETACIMAAEQGHGDDETTLAVGFNVQQLTPALLDSQIIVVAEIVSLGRNRIRYKVFAKDASGTVAVGEHTRALVKKAALANQLMNRMMIAL